MLELKLGAIDEEYFGKCSSFDIDETKIRTRMHHTQEAMIEVQ
jgi:hypothetical protein